MQKLILEWYRHSGRDLPWRRTRDPYHVLVSEVMLQQTQVERVLPKYEQWLEAFPTLADLAAAPLAEAIKLWAPLGYNGRAVRLHGIARQCIDRHGGMLPDSFEQLMRLKGVGRYTAGAIACFAYGQQVTFWDTNVSRVLTRLLVGHDAGCTPNEMEALAGRALPDGEAYDWHQALMDLGATICKSRVPRCDLCPAVQHCAAHPAVLFAPLRVAERKAGYKPERFETTDRYFRGRVVDLLRQRSPQARSALAARLQREEPAWFGKLLNGLERDGLIAIDGDLVSLP